MTKIYLTLYNNRITDNLTIEEAKDIIEKLKTEFYEIKKYMLDSAKK